MNHSGGCGGSPPAAPCPASCPAATAAPPDRRPGGLCRCPSLGTASGWPAAARFDRQRGPGRVTTWGGPPQGWAALRGRLPTAPQHCLKLPAKSLKKKKKALYALHGDQVPQGRWTRINWERVSRNRGRFLGGGNARGLAVRTTKRKQHKEQN